MPAEADTLAHFKLLNPFANSGNGADDLMTGNKRELADAPIVGNEVKIAVADAAMGDGYLHFLRA